MGALAAVLACGCMWALVRGHSLFTCEPVTAPRCTAMTYNMTFFPNLLGHYDQDTAAVRMEVSAGQPGCAARGRGRGEAPPDARLRAPAWRRARTGFACCFNGDKLQLASSRTRLGARH